MKLNTKTNGLSHRKDDGELCYAVKYMYIIGPLKGPMSVFRFKLYFSVILQDRACHPLPDPLHLLGTSDRIRLVVRHRVQRLVLRKSQPGN